VSLWTPLAFEADRNALVLDAEHLLPVAGAVPERRDGVCAVALARDGREIPPFIATIVLFLLGYAGIGFRCSLSVLPSLTIWDTAAAPSSHRFMLIGTLGRYRSSSAISSSVLDLPRQGPPRRGLPSLNGRHHRAGAKRRDPVMHHFTKAMDCRVKPGNDDRYEGARHPTSRSAFRHLPSARCSSAR